jgi:hypothetical protein
MNRGIGQDAILHARRFLRTATNGGQRTARPALRFMQRIQPDQGGATHRQSFAKDSGDGSW